MTMARIIYGGIITELAGSIGGVTFQRNSSGTIARLKPDRPLNPSPGQQLKNTLLSQMVAAWHALSSANKITWSNFAAAHDHVDEYNTTKHLNGFQWFMSCNLNLLATGQATISAAPAWTVVTAPPAYDVFADADLFYAEFENPFDWTGYRAAFYATPLLQKTNEQIRNNLFFLHSFDPGLMDTFDLLSYYATLFDYVWNTIVVNSSATIIVKLKKVQEATGLASPFTTASVTLIPV